MRTYVRKTQRASASKETFELAAAQVLLGKSCRAAAKEYELCHMSLGRYIKKKEKFNASGNRSDEPRVGYALRRYIPQNMEAVLAEYALTVSRLYYGMTPHDLRKLAFQFCVANNIDVPEVWRRNEIAGPDWMAGFLKRNANLSIRPPEATSLARASAFNRHSVAEFFSNLRTVMMRHKFPPEAIYNTDETGVTTVQRPSKVIAQKGVKQIGKMTSGERGELVTVACVVNAIGTALPPMIIFPRVRYHEHFVNGAPVGSIGAGTKSGWMTEESFMTFLQHFQKHTKSSEDSPVLLVLDNHSSHISIQALDYAKSNAITILTFPPHCSHKLQPLDRTVYGPFKRFYNNAADNWMINHPGANMSIYDIPQLVEQAFKSAMTPGNIASGFRVSGIFPFNDAVFGDDEFLPSNVTDRDAPAVAGPAPAVAGPAPAVAGPAPAVAGPAPAVAGPAPAVAGPAPAVAGPAPAVAGPAPAVAGPAPAIAGPSTSVTSPEQLRPYPRAPPRKTHGRGRRRGTTMIATDTPIKKKLEEIQKSRSQPKNSKRKLPIGQRSSKKGKKASEERKLEGNQQEWYCLVCAESYASSLPKERWVQCESCMKWSHEQCTGGNDSYICDKCDDLDSE